MVGDRRSVVDVGVADAQPSLQGSAGRRGSRWPEGVWMEKCAASDGSDRKQVGEVWWFGAAWLPNATAEFLRPLELLMLSNDLYDGFDLLSFLAKQIIYTGWEFKFCVRLVWWCWFFPFVSCCRSWCEVGISGWNMMKLSVKKILAFDYVFE